MTCFVDRNAIRSLDHHVVLSSLVTLLLLSKPSIHGPFTTSQCKILLNV